jgi:hypothetical protein
MERNRHNQSASPLRGSWYIDNLGQLRLRWIHRLETLSIVWKDTSHDTYASLSTNTSSAGYGRG